MTTLSLLQYLLGAGAGVLVGLSLGFAAMILLVALYMLFRSARALGWL